MFKIYTCLSLVAAVAMTGCSTTYDQSPYHNQRQAVVTQSGQQAPTNISYQDAPRYSATSASFQSLRCPAGTTPHSSGTCLLDETAAGLPTRSVATAPAPSFQQVQTAPRAASVISASTAPMTPSYFLGEEVSRPLGVVNYQVVSGDTVYSLARKLCVPVSSIQKANGLDAAFAINVGQGLQLPASRC